MRNIPQGDLLDKLIATEFLGWYEVDYGFGFQPPYSIGTEPLHPFSRDMEYASVVLKKLKVFQYKTLEIAQDYKDDLNANWSVILNGKKIVSNAKSQPHAICLAALRMI